MVVERSPVLGSLDSQIPRAPETRRRQTESMELDEEDNDKDLDATASAQWVFNLAATWRQLFTTFLLISPSVFIRFTSHEAGKSVLMYLFRASKVDLLNTKLHPLEDCLVISFSN